MDLNADLSSTNICLLLPLGVKIPPLYADVGLDYCTLKQEEMLVWDSLIVTKLGFSLRCLMRFGMLGLGRKV